MAAIVFGIVLGGVVAFVLIIQSKEQQLAKNKSIKPTDNTIQSSNAVNVNFQPLEITDPPENGIVYKNTVTIKGVFTKNSLIIIQSPIKDVAFKNVNGQFSVDFPLALGENVIRISAYPQDKQLREQEKETNVYYFEQQL